METKCQLMFVKNTYTIRELQRAAPSAVRGAETGALVTVTRHEKPVVHMISDERLGALLETIELAGNADFVASVGRLRAGRTKFLPVSSI